MLRKTRAGQRRQVTLYTMVRTLSTGPHNVKPVRAHARRRRSEGRGAGIRAI